MEVRMKMLQLVGASGMRDNIDLKRAIEHKFLKMIRRSLSEACEMKLEVTLRVG